MGLAQRIKIAVDVADAFVYLHFDCGRPIVHCDLKPTNILLDDEMNAYLGDFGIASLLSDSRSTIVGKSCSHSSIAVTGTIGYIPPGKDLYCILYLYKGPFHADEYNLNF